jgi:hypothetical protein
MDDSNFLSRLKRTVTIPRPMPSMYKRGLAADHEGASTRTVRIPIDEIMIIDKASQMLSMSRSSFMRWCSYNVAIDIINQKREYDKRK